MENINFVNFEEAKKIILNCFDIKKVPFLKGSPGIAKSALYHEVAKRFNLFLIDVRLGLIDATDINGFPYLDKDINKMRFMPPEMFPLESDKIPEGYKGWLILFDELNSATEDKQAAAYKIILDRKVGEYNLHNKVWMSAAGNLDSDDAVVYDMPTPLKSRLIHIRMKSDLKSFLDWGLKNNLNHRIAGFLNFAPAALHDFDPNSDSDTYTCYRTWTFVSDFLNSWDSRTKKDEKFNMSYARQMAIVGTIGSSRGHEFINFLNVYQDLVTFEEIVNDPENAKLNTDIDKLYAVCLMITHKITELSSDQCIKYIKRMEPEYQVMFIKNLFSKDKSWKTNNHVNDWKMDFVKIHGELTL